MRIFLPKKAELTEFVQDNSEADIRDIDPNALHRNVDLE
jgi:hypothetical protein